MSSGCPVQHHGTSKASGCQHAALGHFSELFKKKKSGKSYSPPGVEVSEDEAAILGGPGGIMHDYDSSSGDSGIPAGYTFFAQFVDHDITLDTTSQLTEDPRTPEGISGAPNLRTASLDLDCVYGFGPEASPHIYDGTRPGRLGVGNADNPDDLPRSPTGAALIGDPRNDENIFVSQLQLLFHRFHNKIYNQRVSAPNPHSRFEKSQEEARYHYQWLVLYDFLKRVCDPDVYAYAIGEIEKSAKLENPKYPHLYDGGMPVEFSVAAYRFGHTMVRSEYAINADNLDVELFDERFGTLGFSSLPPELVVDWRYLLPVYPAITPRMSKGIDHLFADELQNLPVVPSNNPNERALAFRNLRRGHVMSLLSGQDAATILKSGGYPVDPNVNLALTDIPGWDRLPSSGKSGHRFESATPLLLYILRESDVSGANHLGAVGSAILMEVFGGMLLHCGTSFLRHRNEKGKLKSWKPDHIIAPNGPDAFELADVVRFVG